VDVIGHDGESVKLELFGVSISEKRCYEEFGVCGKLEVAMALEVEIVIA
jgi:hypothetical protein